MVAMMMMLMVVGSPHPAEQLLHANQTAAARFRRLPSACSRKLLETPTISLGRPSWQLAHRAFESKNLHR